MSNDESAREVHRQFMRGCARVAPHLAAVAEHTRALAAKIVKLADGAQDQPK